MDTLANLSIFYMDYNFVSMRNGNRIYIENDNVKK